MTRFVSRSHFHVIAPALVALAAVFAAGSARAQQRPPASGAAAVSASPTLGVAISGAQGTTQLHGLRPVTSPRVITLDDAFATAIQQSFDLRIAQARIDESESQVKKAWSTILPQLSAFGEYTYNYPEQTISLADPRQIQEQALVFDALSGLTAAQANQVTDPTQKLGILQKADQLEKVAKQIRATKIQDIIITPAHVVDGAITFSLPLFNARALPLLQNAYAGVDVTRLGVRSARAGVIYAVARSYFQVVASKRIVDIAQKQVQSATQHRDLAKQRVDEGLSTPLTLQRAELDLAKAQAQVLQAEGGLRLAKGGLGSLLGVVDDFDVAEPPPVPALEQGKSADALLQQALDARDDLKSEKLALGIADRSKTDAWMRFLPSIGLEAQGRGTSNTSGLVTDPFTGAVIVQANVPIFDGGYTLASIDEADAKLREELLRVHQLEALVEQEVRGTLDDLETKRVSVETADRVAELARAQKANVDDLFGAGAATALDVSDASLAQFSAEVDAARARFDLETARLGLAYATGELRPNEDLLPKPLSDTEAQKARDEMGAVKTGDDDGKK